MIKDEHPTIRSIRSITKIASMAESRMNDVGVGMYMMSSAKRCLARFAIDKIRYSGETGTCLGKCGGRRAPNVLMSLDDSAPSSTSSVADFLLPVPLPALPAVQKRKLLNGVYRDGG